MRYAMLRLTPLMSCQIQSGTRIGNTISRCGLPMTMQLYEYNRPRARQATIFFFRIAISRARCRLFPLIDCKKIMPQPARTGNPFLFSMSDRLRALATVKEIEDTFDAIYRRPVYLSHSLANAVRLLRKSSQSSGISNLIFSRGSPPGGGAAPCLAE